VRRALVIALAISVSACATSMRRRPVTSAAQEWPTTLSAATAAATSGDYDEADRMLDDYAHRHPGTPQARETSYWRALLEIDPANSAGSTHAAQQRLAEYLADSTDLRHREEAEVLRRLVTYIDSAHAYYRAALTNAESLRAAQAAQSSERQQELQKEILRLKEQLERTTAELDRIKRRLAGRGP
jgi:hypothetical protein